MRSDDTEFFMNGVVRSSGFLFLTYLDGRLKARA